MFEPTPYLKNEMPVHVLKIHKSHPDYDINNKVQCGLLRTNDVSVPCIRMMAKTKMSKSAFNNYLKSVDASESQISFLNDMFYTSVEAVYHY